MAMAIQLQAPVPASALPTNRAACDGMSGEEWSVVHPYLMRTDDTWFRAIVSEDRHLNVLIHCVDLPLASAVAEIAELCSRPLWTCAVPGALQLPENDGETVLVGDVSTLTLLQQIELYEWLDRFGRSSQVVSLTSTPLWPLVERGRFLDGLFYRLNVVTLTADPIRH